MLWLLALLLSTSAPASDEIPDTDMHAVAKEVMTLQKFLFSPAEFSSPKAEEPIKESLAAVKQHLDRLEKKVFTDQPALRLNVGMISRQVSEADAAFRAGHKAYARYTLESSLQLCIACHTRTASPDFVLPAADLKGATTREKADFYFATRQFDLGRTAYEDVLKEEGGSLGPEELRNVALSLAVYYARVKEDPAGGESWFRAQAANKALPAAFRKELQGWAGEFAKWAKEKAPEPYALSEAEMLKKAEGLLKGKGALNEVRQLRASSLLHGVLETPGANSPAKAQALRLLGETYAGLRYQLFYQFGEMYLEACIDEYPKQKAAQDCYRSLEKSVRGRSGPESAETIDLARWKKKAF